MSTRHPNVKMLVLQTIQQGNLKILCAKPKYP